MEQTPATLELSVHKIDQHRYTVVLRFTNPNGDNTDQIASDELVLEPERLLDLELEDRPYGELLTNSLLQGKIRELFGQARAAMQLQQAPISFRLFIDASAAELNNVHWERMADLDSDAWLTTQPNLRFSRYLTSRDWRPVRTGRRKKLNALVLIANPRDVGEYGLPPIDVKRHLEIAKEALDSATIADLTGRATSAELLAGLGAGVDILYLVCHGKLDPKTRHPHLFLEKKDGTVDRFDAIDLALAIEELERRPRLVMLLSCESASAVSVDRDAAGVPAAAIGVRLAQAGVPATVAMHALLSESAAFVFVPSFFKALTGDVVDGGRVDHAMTVARAELRQSKSPDWWKPVLITRLATGQLWYSKEMCKFDKWDSLVAAIRERQCTPIIGPGIAEHVLGGRRDLAIRWAGEKSYPLSEGRNNLAQVAQFVAVRESPFFVRNTLKEFAKRELSRRYDTLLLEIFKKELEARAGEPPTTPERIRAAIKDSSLADRLRLVGRRLMEADDTDPSRILAELDLPFYVVANYSSLMEEALRLRNRKPIVHHYRWKDELEEYWTNLEPEENQAEPRPPRPKPSVASPLVCRLFGAVEETETLALSEDDYLDYLLGLNRARDQQSTEQWGIPSGVTRRFNSTSLLFLGFTMDDWGFRVLLRSILRKEGSEGRKPFAHVAVQLDPEEGQAVDRNGAKRYLEQYFGGSAVGLYWGDVREFMTELRDRLA